jgi:hypothetical protein
MPNCYQRLNFPRNFLKEGLSLSIFDFDGVYALYPFSTVLSEDLLSFLKDFPLEQDFVAVFNSKNKQSGLENRMIHSDISLDKSGHWKDLLFGVHYELEDTVGYFHWWDMKDAEKIYPDSDKDQIRSQKFKRLNGIHYGMRGHFGKLENSEIIETAQITGPTLVRTDVPHCVTYRNPNRNRMSFSLRFQSKFQTWQEVRDFFKPFELLDQS